MALGINDAGQIVGYFDDVKAGTLGFLKDGAIFTTIDVPDPTTFRTMANWINDAGQIVGRYFAGLTAHGFLKDGATFTTIDVPGAIETDAYGINNAARSWGSSMMPQGSTVFSRHQYPNPRIGHCSAQVCWDWCGGGSGWPRFCRRKEA
jgi:hypothetical protein